MNRETYRSMIRECLCNFWNSVEAAPEDAFRRACDLFLTNCVRDDMRAKFKETFERSSKPIGRMLIGAREVDRGDSFAKVLGLTNLKTITSIVIWESFDQPIGCRVNGVDQPIGNLIFSDENALIQLEFKSHVEFLLHDCHREETFRCSVVDARKPLK